MGECSQLILLPLPSPDVSVYDSTVSSWVKGAQPPSDHNVVLTVVVRIDDDRRAGGTNVLGGGRPEA